MRWIGKETLVSFEEGRVGKEAIIGVGGVVDVRLLCGPADRRLGLEVIDFVRVISRGNCGTNGKKVSKMSDSNRLLYYVYSRMMTHKGGRC